MIIPPEVQIGAHTIRIRHNEEAMRIANLRGQMSLPEGTIRLSFEVEGIPRTVPQVFESLLHEFIHAIDCLYMKELEERQIMALAAGLAQVLVSIGIEPDFSQVPEE